MNINHHFRYTLLSLALLLPPSQCVAGRTLLIPPLPRRYVLPYSASIPVGESLGFRAHLRIHLQNVSNKIQSGTLSILPGTDIYGQFVGTSISATRRVYICGDNGNGSNNAPDATLALPEPIRWTLPANGSKLLQMGTYFVFTRTNGLPNELISAEMSPILKIEVTQDQGAVLATSMHDLDGNGLGTTNCDDYIPTTQHDVNLPFERNQPPMYLNGGRPF